MTQQEITHGDCKAVEKLREYARINVDVRTDAEFIAWVESVVKVISTQEWQRIKKIMETDPAFNENKEV